jgi:hypothetical protein
MLNRTVRCIGYTLVSVATVFLVLGVLLVQAAYSTGAARDYKRTVTWLTALRAIWPPSWWLLLLLLSALGLSVVTLLVFRRASRWIAVATLLFQVAIIFRYGGGPGIFFINRELANYHFRMDAERLGEYWFVFEALAVWMLTVAVLAVIRMFVPMQQHAESSTQPASSNS